MELNKKKYKLTNVNFFSIGDIFDISNPIIYNSDSDKNWYDSNKLFKNFNSVNVKKGDYYIIPITYLNNDLKNRKLPKKGILVYNCEFNLSDFNLTNLRVRNYNNIYENNRDNYVTVDIQNVNNDNNMLRLIYLNEKGLSYVQLNQKNWCPFINKKLTGKFNNNLNDSYIYLFKNKQLKNIKKFTVVESHEFCQNKNIKDEINCLSIKNRKTFPFNDNCFGLESYIYNNELMGFRFVYSIYTNSWMYGGIFFDVNMEIVGIIFGMTDPNFNEIDFIPNILYKNFV